METAAPAGYKLNEEPVSFILSEHPSSQIEYDITGDRLSLKDEAEKVSIPVTKTWVGPVGADAVVVHLLADGTDTGKTITLSADGNWTGEFDNLRKFDDTGEEIWYSVAEDPMDNYVPRYDGSADTGYTITNINTETLEIPVEKRWIGPAAKSVTINLLADGKVTDSAVLNEENEWKHIFTNLPKYDADGNMKDWWTAQDAKGFEKRADLYANFFSNIKVLPDLNANGRFTLGENLADHGGLQVAFNAYKNATAKKPLKEKNGFTADQRFFLAYAGVWGQNITEKEIRNRVKRDPHSLGEWRVNGALPHIDAWYKAFNVKKVDKMYLPENERLQLW